MDNKRDTMRFFVFLASTAIHSVLGTCDRLRTACGIVKDKRLCSIGYNGSVSGMPHCDDAGHLMSDNHCIRTRHGEKNAISNTDREHLREGQAIIIATPCLICIQDLAEEGVTEIDYVGTYDNARGKEHIDDFIKTKGITLRAHQIDWAELFQNLFDLLARDGGLLARAGYRLRIVKEPIETKGNTSNEQ